MNELEKVLLIKGASDKKHKNKTKFHLWKNRPAE